MATFGDINPTTGKKYSTQDIQRINAGLEPSVTTEFAVPGEKVTYEKYAEIVPEGATEAEIKTNYEAYLARTFTTPTLPVEGEVPITPTFGEGVAAEIPTPEVVPAPAYEVSPELQEKMDLYGEKVTDWVEAGGYGLDPETQAQMIQLQTDTLKARETENIRVMRNNMERRGITNSGFLIAAESAIHSNTSVAIAGAIADVQIKSAVLKLASFETAMGQMANFLGFLSEQSQLAYAPEFATWQAEQLATMQVWQGKLDILKIDLNQAYQTQNTILQAELTSQLNEQQQGFNIELAEMEIEANQKIATAQGIGGIFGTILGFIFGK